MSATAKTRPAQNNGAPAGHKGNGKPAAFNLDAYIAEAVRVPFTFTLGGRQFTLPHMSDLDWHIAIGPGGDMTVPTVHELLRKGLGGQFAEFDKLPLPAAGYNELWKRWQAHSGVDLGESPASPAS